jgi:hypothetical protein
VINWLSFSGNVKARDPSIWADARVDAVTAQAQIANTAETNLTIIPFMIYLSKVDMEFSASAAGPVQCGRG